MLCGQISVTVKAHTSSHGEHHINAFCAGFLNTPEDKSKHVVRRQDKFICKAQIKDKMIQSN